MNTDMTGKVALVTGAASGLGRATALKLAAAGADLALVDVNEAGLAETAQLLAPFGRQVMAHAANLADAGACAPVVVDSVARFGRLDALCNVAGVIRMANAEIMPRSDWDLTIAINLTAPFLLSQAAIPHLLESNGAIVNVASSAAFIGEAYAAAYCASKAGLVNLTKAMAMEFSRKPIRINAVAPGTIESPYFTKILSGPDGAELRRGLEERQAMERLGKPVEIAQAILWLASDDASFCTGTVMVVDGGWTARGDRKLKKA